MSKNKFNVEVRILKEAFFPAYINLGIISLREVTLFMKISSGESKVKEQIA